jgi:hypothetical protein
MSLVTIPSSPSLATTDTAGAAPPGTVFPAQGTVPAFVTGAASIAPGTDKASQYNIEPSRILAQASALTIASTGTPVIGPKLIACYALALGYTLSIVNGPGANTIGTFASTLTKPSGLIVKWDGTDYRFVGYVEL